MQDRTLAAGRGVNTRWLGWGVGFLDLERDGWPDLFHANGHVYPDVSLLAGGLYSRPGTFNVLPLPSPGPFRVNRRLGAGSMGEVYARHSPAA